MENNLHIIVGDPVKQTKNISLPFKIEIVEDIFAEVRYQLNSAQNYLYILIFASDINRQITSRSCHGRNKGGGNQVGRYSGAGIWALDNFR